ncbi:MAG: hypothetical protein ACXVD2_03345 [Actinomycetota bacterium]
MRDRILRTASVSALAVFLLMLLPASGAFAGLASISSVSPNALKRGDTGIDLTINGSLFSPGPTVTFSGTGIAVNSTTYQDPSHIVVNVSVSPDATTGPITVTVDDPVSGSTACSDCFSITPPPAIAADDYSVGQGATDHVVSLTGTGFLNGATVAISGLGVSAGSTVWNSATSISVPITASAVAPAGTRDITITNPDSQADTCTGCLTIDPAPRASSFSPAQRGPGLTGQAITVSGSGFMPGTSIAFSGTEITAGTASSITGTALNVDVDIDGAAAPGSHDVTLTNPDGGTSTCTGCFQITGPTTVSLSSPSALSGPIVASFDQPVGGISSSNFFVTVAGQTAKLPATITCTDSSGRATSCSTDSAEKANLLPSSPLIAGQQYTASIAPDGASAVTDFGGLHVQGATLDFRGGSIQEAENTVATTPTWRQVGTSAAYGGSYSVDHLANASASFVFRGTSVIWYTNIGPNYGVANVYIDGALKGVVNSYSSTTHYRARYTITGLSAQTHTLRIVVRGVKGSSHGTGTDVAIDAFAVGKTFFSTPKLAYTWQRIAAVAASGRYYIRSDRAGSTASFTFRGTRVTWYTVLSPSMGLARVYVDGHLKGTYDNYCSSVRYGMARTYAGLSDGVHTIRIVVLGTHRAASTGASIAIDRWVVA